MEGNRWEGGTMSSQEEWVTVVQTESEAPRAQRAFVRLLLAIVWVLLASCTSALAQEARRGLDAIEHVVVIYAENRSFDHLFGLFPGANGIAQATHPTQVDHDGTPLPYLTVWKGGNPDPAFPTQLPNKPFRLDGDPVYRPMSVPTGSIVHLFYHNQEQINGGRNDKFVAVSDAGGLAMGYYDGAQLAMWKWAQEYTLADHFLWRRLAGRTSTTCGSSARAHQCTRTLPRRCAPSLMSRVGSGANPRHQPRRCQGHRPSSMAP